MLTPTSCHIPIFAAYITLSAGILWFVNRNSNTPIDSGEAKDLSEEEYDVLRIRALWDIGASLSVIVFGYTCQALLDKPLDQPGTLMVNSRHLRLIGRPIYIFVILIVLLKADLNVYLYMGICGIGISNVLLYESICGLERPARFLEPRGLTVLMKKEYRPARQSGEMDADHEIRIPI